MKKLIICIITLLSVVSCESVNLRIVDEPAFKIGLKQILTRYLQKSANPVETAVSVINTASGLKNFLDFQPRTLDELKQKLQERVISNGPVNGNDLLWLDLADFIDIELKTDMGDGIISDENKITINNLIDLATQRARLFIR